MNNSDEPAFSFTDNRSSDYADNQVYYGLTKREYFIAKAMQGLIVSMKNNTQELVKVSIETADAMLSALEPKEAKIKAMPAEQPDPDDLPPAA